MAVYDITEQQRKPTLQHGKLVIARGYAHFERTPLQVGDSLNVIEIPPGAKVVSAFMRVIEPNESNDASASLGDTATQDLWADAGDLTPGVKGGKWAQKAYPTGDAVVIYCQDSGVPTPIASGSVEVMAFMIPIEEGM